MPTPITLKLGRGRGLRVSTNRSLRGMVTDAARTFSGDGPSIDTAKMICSLVRLGRETWLAFGDTEFQLPELPPMPDADPAGPIRKRPGTWIFKGSDAVDFTIRLDSYTEEFAKQCKARFGMAGGKVLYAMIAMGYDCLKIYRSALVSTPWPGPAQIRAMVDNGRMGRLTFTTVAFTTPGTVTPVLPPPMSLTDEQRSDVLATNAGYPSPDDPGGFWR